MIGLYLLTLLVACADPADRTPKAVISSAATPVAGATISGDKLPILPANSRIEFTGSKVTGSEGGRFEQFTGAIELVEGNPEKSRVSVEIEMNSVVTQSRGLDEHLKTADFFEVGRFPKSSFVSTAIRSGGAGNGAYTVTGNLEMRGVKKSIAFPAVIRVEADAVTVDSEFAINRKDFGIVYAGRTNDLIRDEVALKLTIKAQRPKLSQR
jgi:polyisoprenoid-binding protein YceI